jgi:hypothetical protein
VGAKGCKGMLVVVVGAVELGPSRQFGVEPRGAEQIESENRLGKQQAPMEERKVGVTATKAGNEMVFEGLNCAFCGIATVDVGGSELVGNILLLEEGFEGGGALIVESLEPRAATGADERVVELDVAGLDDRRFATGKGLNGNVVAVVVIEEEKVVVAFAGGQREAASEITIAATGGRAVKHGSKEEMGSGAIVEAQGKKIRVRRLREEGQGRIGGLCGLDVLADLFEVGFGSGHRIRGVLAERSECQAREGLKGVIGG